jgi:DnaK suppressor protein
MAKAKPKKPAPKAKPAAKKSAPAKKPAPVKSKAAVPAKKAASPTKKKPLPPKKVIAPAKKPVAVTKKPAAAPIKKPAPVSVKSAVAPEAKQTKANANANAASAISPAKVAAPGKITAVTSMPVKPMPIPSEVLKLKDKSTTSETSTGAEKREIHQSDIFSEDELRMFLEALKLERTSLLEKARAAVDGGNIALDKDEMYDEVDLASATVDQNLTFRLLDRDRKLLGEIDHAIQKIQTGEFGYCEGTGEPIPKRRLELRPWCRHSVKYKEQLEKLEKSGRGVVDEDAEMLD